MFLKEDPKNKPQLTVGLCVRNCEKSVEAALDSILDQNFLHNQMELVLVDDGSEDSTLKIVQEFVSKIDIPTKVLHTSWKGLGHARNMVIANAGGKYILWVDGDMGLSQNYIAPLMEFMQKNTKAGIVKGKQSLTLGGNVLSILETCSRAAGRMVNYQSQKARFKTLGTGGSIYRVEAIRQAGGFDENLRGYGEDSDAEIRVRTMGWSLHTLDVEFSDFERYEMNWQSIWRRYWLRGYYSHYFHHKNRGFISLYRMSPVAAFISGLLFSRRLYSLTKRKVIFLLPIQHLFKMSGWYAGFLRSHINRYEPKP